MAETWRSVIFGILGAVFATWILGNATDDAKFQRENKVKALNEFIYKSSAYTATAADFCRVRDPETDKAFKSTIVDEYRVSINALDLYFEDRTLSGKADNARKAADALFEMCNTHEKSRPSMDQWKPAHDSLKEIDNDIATYALKQASRWWWPW